MMELVAGHGTARDVLAYAERAKARVLLDVLARGRVNVTKAMTPQESEQEQALRGELVGLNGLFYRENARPKPDQVRLRGLQKRLERARLAYSGFQTKLYALHPELKVRRGDFTPVSLEEAAELLPGPNGAILEYEVTDKRTYLLVLTRTGSEPRLQLYPVEIDSEKLKRQVESFRDQVSRRDLGFRQAAASLYDLLLRPARRQLAGRKSLIVAPDGPLWELPFQALQAAANRYVLEEYAISYAPSIAVLREMRRLGKHAEGKRELADSIWAIGNPAPHAQREPLPETERQVKELARLYGAARAKVYVGREAREERFKAEAGRFGLVHLATHGVLNDVSPMYSYLLLSQANENAKEDGLLETWELMAMDLEADLVVLSACETARGRVGAGEGLIGLSWALFVAGTPAAVVSQWKVESESTTRLMLQFHSELRAGAPIAKALRQAALQLLRSEAYRHPFYWAPFVVVGDGY
jgi:CHAT domain-containing protein